MRGQRDDIKSADFQFSTKVRWGRRNKPVFVSGYDDLIVGDEFAPHGTFGNSKARLVNEPECQIGLAGSGLAQNQDTFAIHTYAGSMQADLMLRHSICPGRRPVIFDRRQAHHKPCAQDWLIHSFRGPAITVLGPDAALVGINNLLGDGKAETGILTE